MAGGLIKEEEDFLLILPAVCENRGWRGRKLAADGADAIVRADKQGPAYPAARGPDILLYAAGARHMAKCLIAGWKSEEEINAKDKCPGSGH